MFDLIPMDDSGHQMNECFFGGIHAFHLRCWKEQADPYNRLSLDRR